MIGLQVCVMIVLNFSSVAFSAAARLSTFLLPEQLLLDLSSVLGGSLESRRVRTRLQGVRLQKRKLVLRWTRHGLTLMNLQHGRVLTSFQPRLY
jgi:hypothetical protein